MGTGQFAIDFHAVITGNPVFHAAFQRASRAADIGFRRQVHLDFIAAAEGDVAASFIFAFLVQFRPLVHGDLIGGNNRIIAVSKYVFRNAAALAFHLIVDIQIGIRIVNLAFSSRYLGILVNHYIGLAGQHLLRFDIRRNLDDTAHAHVVIPAFPVVGAGHDLVGRQHVALARSQLRAFFQFRFGIHLHIVVGVGPGCGKRAACAGLGRSFGCNLLEGANVGVTGHIPCAGQRRRIGRLGIHGNGSRRAPGRKAAGIAVRQTFGRIAAACADLQVLQFYRRITARIGAFCFHYALVVAFCLGVAGADGKAAADGSIP